MRHHEGVRHILVRCVVRLVIVALCGHRVLSVRWAARQCLNSDSSEGSIFDFTISDVHQKVNLSLSQFRGQIVLITNVATYCAFTSHYLQLNTLQDSYKNFTILGFPSNQFGLQEPGANGTEILNGIKHVRPGNGYTPNFPIFKKIDVNGEHEHPLYTYLKKNCPATRDDFAHQKHLFYSPMHVRDIRWNWVKFLINKKGKPMLRYDYSVEPRHIAKDIEQLLMQDP